MRGSNRGTVTPAARDGGGDCAETVAAAVQAEDGETKAAVWVVTQ